MSERDRRQQAAQNNAAWCDAMFRSHGLHASFSEDIWFSIEPAPRFYPNAVTLTSDAGNRAPMQVITDVIKVAREKKVRIAIKDSYQQLDLAGLGCQELFDAEWLCLPADAIRPAAAVAEITWRRVATAAELAAWEQAWNAGEDAPRLFLPRLLAEPATSVIGAFSGQQIVAGCILHQAAGVVGYSNLFLPAADTMAFRQACIETISHLMPGQAIVGYESGDESLAMQVAGFQPLGPLRVWILSEESLRQ